MTPTAPPSSARRAGLALAELAVVLVVLAAIALVAVPRLSQADIRPRVANFASLANFATDRLVLR